MPKVMNQDIINKIAEYAGRGYSKSVTAKELGLNRTTVWKYWPREEGAEEKKLEQPIPQLSLEQEFNLLSRKVETAHELESLLSKIEGRRWETEGLKAKGEAAEVGIDYLREKLDEAKSPAEVDGIGVLVDKVKNNVTALLAEDEPLYKQRQERETEEEETLMQARLKELAWLFPCSREQARKIVDRLVLMDPRADADNISSLYYIALLLMDAEDLEWGDDATELKPLLTECANLLKGDWNEGQRIMGIAYKRKGILASGDEDVEEKFGQLIDSLTGKITEHSAEIVFKFNAALGRLAEEQYVDTEKLLSKEPPAGLVSIASCPPPKG